jgi:hypothetical protein
VDAIRLVRTSDNWKQGSFCNYAMAMFVVYLSGMFLWREWRRRLSSLEGLRKTNKRLRRTQGPIEAKEPRLYSDNIPAWYICWRDWAIKSYLVLTNWPAKCDGQTTPLHLQKTKCPTDHPSHTECALDVQPTFSCSRNYFFCYGTSFSITVSTQFLTSCSKIFQFSSQLIRLFPK